MKQTRNRTRTLERMPRSAGRIVMALAALVAIAAVCHGGRAAAVATAYWATDSYAGFLRGKPSGVSILESGRIVPGVSMERLDIPDCEYVWSAAVGPRGEIYVTTGTPGTLRRADAGGERVLLEMDDVDLPALAVGWGGDVFVGTAPGGEIYRVDPDGGSELFYETGENYIWAMAFSPEHGLIVGTGEEATVIALDRSGKVRVLSRPADLNVVTLAVGGGRVFAGTGGEGLLLDVTPERVVEVLYDSRYDEISGIVPGADGSLFFSASSISMDQALDEMADPGVPLGDGAVYRATDGGAYEIWQSTDSPVVSLGTTPSGAIIAGAGGLLFAVEPGSNGIVADFEEGEVLSIVPSGDYAVVTTGSPGAVYMFGRDAVGGGHYESRVFDAVTSAHWGSCLVTADRSNDVSIETRSGNLERPDDTWTDWAPLESGKVASPASRFLQWRMEFDGGAGGGAALRSVEIAYLRENVPPQIVSVTVSAAGSGFSVNGHSSDSAMQTLASGLEVTYSLSASGRPVEGVPPVARGLRTVEWDAFDPNGDTLTFDLYVRGEGDGEWGLMAGDLDRSVHTWDSYSMPDGDYRMRVVVSDRPGNPAGSAFEAEGTSGAFVIDNTPPTVKRIELTRSGDGATLEVEIEDVSSPLVAVEVSVDYGDWQPVFPADGMYDTLVETGRLEVDELPRGEHAVAVRAFDRPGNVGVRRSVVEP